MKHEDDRVTDIYLKAHEDLQSLVNSMPTDLCDEHVARKYGLSPEAAERLVTLALAGIDPKELEQ